MKEKSLSISYDVDTSQLDRAIELAKEIGEALSKARSLIDEMNDLDTNVSVKLDAKAR